MKTGEVFVGRLIRFGLEALLAIYFGRKVISYVNSAALEYLVYALMAIAVVGSVFSLTMWLRRRPLTHKAAQAMRL